MATMFDPSMTMGTSIRDISTQQHIFVEGCAGFAAGATAAVALRIFARWHKSTKMGLDDYAIALSLIPLWALAGTGIGIARYGGLGQVASTLTSQQAAIFYPAAFASYILYGLAITAAKLSILLLYRRIFTAAPFRRIIHFFMAVCSIWCILVVFLAIFRCRPIPAAWTGPSRNTDTTYLATATCIPIRNLYYGTSTSNLFLDIVINLLPARQIWALQLPLRQRILLTGCMCLGIVSVLAGIGRILTIPYLTSDELPASIALPYLFVIIEPAFAIICVCLPTYRPLAVWLGQRAGSSNIGSRVKSFFPSSSEKSSSSANSYPSASSSRKPASSSAPGPPLPLFHTAKPNAKNNSWLKRGSSWFGQKQRVPTAFRTVQRDYPVARVGNGVSSPISPSSNEKRNLLYSSVESTPMSSPQLGYGHAHTSIPHNVAELH